MGATVLQRKTHQTGNHVAEADQFGGTVSAFDAQKGFGRMFVVMDADVERAMTSDFDFLCDVLTTGRERTPLAHDVSSSSEIASGAGLSGPESWLRLVADLRTICRVLPESATP